LRHPKLLYFITEDWYFLSHRLPLALAARAAGYDVALVTNVNKDRVAIEKAGVRIIPFEISRRGLNPLLDALMFLRLVSIYRKERPDLVHHVAIKPVLYGSLAARLTGVAHVVNALAGLGYVFTSDQITARTLRPIIGSLFSRLLNNRRSRLILQNPDDRAMFIRRRFINEDRIDLIRGSGVNTSVFSWRPEPSGVPVVLLASRMLWDKGIREFIEAARRLKNEGVSAHFVLAGDTDPYNPSGISREQLSSWHDEGLIEWIGRRDDIDEIFAKSNIVCLPSYREGLPKVLLEAAACGRAIVAADVPGCREIVRHNENGLLVPPRDPDPLADAIRMLIENPGLRARMGMRGRKIAEAEFCEEIAVKQTMAIYEGMLKNRI
jgi:glycosyltransferase involved in cell wall biosynthesis